MIDMEVIVMSALESDKAVTDLVGDRIYRQTVPDVDSEGNPMSYPYIRVCELNNINDDYTDNKAIASDISMQVDFWTLDDIASIQTAIDELMKSLKFKRTGVTPFYEENTGAYRKAMTYIAKVKLQEEK
ncbi:MULTISPECIES: tail completion protein gp17 [Bacillus]|uniref:tail completion protein gp17 n=1 Tax=Bacillus TaxID=1386 RepID=UPI0014285B69|nr:hypothetical protein [Bacillus velezensis]MEC1700923.1 hypothetical protein [Bacillus velezensis]QIR33250.1 hypothetical protein BVELS4_01993 [Bacillus velezensis]